MRERAGDCGRRHEQKKPRRAEPARDRRSERDQPDAIQQHMRPRPVHKGVGQHRPRLGAAAQHLQFPDLSRLLERGRVGVRPLEQIDQPIRPDGDGQPAWNEGVIPDDPVLDRHRRPVEGRIDADENGDEAKDHNGRIEHRFAAARDPARFVCAHTRLSLSVANSDAPLVEAGTDAGAGCSAPGYPPRDKSKPTPSLWRILVRPTSGKTPSSGANDSVAGRTECA